MSHETCRAWLTSVMPRHTTQDWGKDKNTEEQLFNDLKDGKFLCRLLQFLTKEEMGIKNRLQNIHLICFCIYKIECFSTNNVSSLEEYNVNLFLTNLSKLKIAGIDDKLFGEKKATVFREYENFPDVLNGIAKLSRLLEKKTNVKGYDGYRKSMKPSKGSQSDRIDSVTPVRGQVNSIYNENAYEESPYETYYDYAEEDSGNLGRAFKEIFLVHKNYLVNCLRKFLIKAH